MWIDTIVLCRMFLYAYSDLYIQCFFPTHSEMLFAKNRKLDFVFSVHTHKYIFCINIDMQKSKAVLFAGCIIDKLFESVIWIPEFFNPIQYTLSLYNRNSEFGEWFVVFFPSVFVIHVCIELCISNDVHKFKTFIWTLLLPF